VPQTAVGPNTRGPAAARRALPAHSPPAPTVRAF